ncbi:ABC transporter permease [Zunongwangia atlantica]|uniref:ABC transporter permease n=1 Tax=Zunongwangia atlantica 22II14-10F7 TaxID=1185767 RepID=A0A1Y1T1G4_9FLAO|nr:ABC transporter permease [Zunongwangia atlantica]ORL44878.1 ABC transporter permease [Zunongwangia atlantica 22II14-10F7]
MIKNYIKIAWRNLLKYKGYSAINIFGLALGMAVTLMIGLWVVDELNYNSYYKSRNRIAQVYQNIEYNGEVDTDNAIPRPLEFALREEFNDKFEDISMASWKGERFMKVDASTLVMNGYSVQPEFTDIIDLKFISGQSEVLNNKNSLLLSKSAATRLFGDKDPIGKMLTVDNENQMIVAGVFEDIPKGNDFSGLDYLMPWSLYADREWIKNASNQWGNDSFQMFVKLADDVKLSEVSGLIATLKKDQDPEQAKYNPEFFLWPIDSWHLYTSFENGKQSGGPIENVWLFSIIGFVVLALACINFMNLSTARSEKRAMEVGIRKAIGSSKNQLIKQFLSESFLVVIFAFILAVGLVLLFLSPFNELSNKTIHFPWESLSFWATTLIFIVITALLSGAYPALYLSSFRPVKVIKGTFKTGKMAALPRKVLVVTQFSVSIALIIGTLIVMSQIEFSKNRPIGYKTSGLIQIPLRGVSFWGKTDVMRNAFMASGAVTEMASSSSPSTEVWSTRSGFSWPGKPQDFQADFSYSMVSYEYVETLGLNVISGRGFSRAYPSDSAAVLINESAARFMNMQDPVGQTLASGKIGVDYTEYKIIGVVEDVIAQSPYSPIKQAVYAFDKYQSASYWNLRLNQNQSVQQNLATIEEVYKNHFPDSPFSFDFVDQEYAKKFAEEERIASLAKIFTLLAMLISCLGLFGLASFVAEQRTKEIGVRKVLGASVANLWLLLSKDFVSLVVVALLIASPIAFYLMHQWIQKFAYRADISLWIFIVAAVGALSLTLLTISFQAIKAAITNPVKSLRTE